MYMKIATVFVVMLIYNLAGVEERQQGIHQYFEGGVFDFP